MLQNLLSERAVRIALLILAAISLTAALKFAQSIFAPIVFALVLGIVVSPVAERLTKAGVPRVAIAVFLLLLTTGFMGALIMLADPLLTTLAEQLPRLKLAAEEWIAMISNLMRGIETISQEIENSVGADALEPQGSIPSVSDALWLAPNFAAQVFVFMGTLFFFVLTRDDLYAATGPLESQLKRADRAVSRYFGAVTLVNTGLGIVTTFVLMAIGVDYAPLWGLAAGLLNFILYLGPMMIVLGLLMAGVVQFSGPMSLLPPAAFLLINLTEAQFVTPMVVGQRLALSPLAVFLSIVFGLWLWGPVGAIVALPVLLWFGVLMQPGVISPSRWRRRPPEAA
ncbi:AI-2E family transporter [Thalassococcus sp. S3]|uniref:AI-2E family transporter n=1 Tax=Thalassococcus sp. S3 TaxID=2017482 RepID=UPI0010242D45|nr:AI-2E family transporter [Thalassococcus sp. S3]QBF33998.1 AI-2E family transporter [Thalassococcus sp. S3]